MKNPNNPYTIDNFLLKISIYKDAFPNDEEIINWYLEQLYQIELELKGELNPNYRYYLEKKHTCLYIGLTSFYNSNYQTIQ